MASTAVWAPSFCGQLQGCFFSTRGGVTGYFSDVMADDRVMGITEHGRPYGRVLCEGPPGVPAKAVKPGGDTQPLRGSSPTILLSVETEEIAAQHSFAPGVSSAATSTAAASPAALATPS